MILNNLNFQFRDRIFAAHALSSVLKYSLSKEERKDSLILGIPRAGVLTADIISKDLHISNFDIIIPRKLTDPDNKEQSIGAIMDDGYKLLNQKLLDELVISKEYIDMEIMRQVNQIKRRKTLFGNSPEETSLLEKISRYSNIILVDDGAATGFTAMVAAKWIRKSVHLNPNRLDRLIIAFPVAPKPVIKMIQNECNAEVKVVFQPSATNFRSVEQYHKIFSIIEDRDVIDILKRRKFVMDPYTSIP